MIPTALTVFFMLLSVAMLFKTWHLQGQTPVYGQVPKLRSSRRTLLVSTLALLGAALAQSFLLWFQLTEPEPQPPEVTEPVEENLAEMANRWCEEDLSECHDTLLVGEKAMLTYDNHCQCPWSPLTLETLDSP